MSTTLHKDLTGADLHVNKLHADTHVVAGTDPLALAESQVTDLPADLADLASGLDGKASTVHTHTKSQITDFPVIPDYPVLGTSALKDVPASGDATVDQVVKGDDTRLTDARTPVAHSHPESEVTDLVTDLAGKVGTGDLRLSDARTPVEHTHVKANITDFPASMPASDVSAWAKAGTKPSYANTEVGAAAASHTHVESDVTDLTADLAGKAPTVHAHVKADVTDFPASMPASDVSAWAKAAEQPAPIAHTQALATISDVTATATELNYVDGVTSAIQTQLNAKVASSDARLSDARVASDVSAWAKAASQPAPIAHNQDESTISGLVADLAGKVVTTDARLSDARAPTAHNQALATITDVTATVTELNYTDGVTSGIQGQLATKVVGPVVSVMDHMATFVDASGQSLRDGGAIPTTLPASDVSAWAKGATKPAYTPAELGAEAVANKSTSVPTDAASDTKYPSVKAVKDYADGLVAGLLDYRGAYNASGNAYPTTGGSGTAGAILKGDMWAISGAGTLDVAGVVQIGDVIVAKMDGPGQNGNNWNTLNTNVSYVPEDQANKENTTLDTSTTKYPTNALVKAGLDGKVGTGDARLSDARVASDVSAWAKAGVKPSYASSEITNISAAGQELINDADALAMLVTLGLTSTATEINYTDGVTSGIQTQFNAITTVLDGLADALDLIVGGA